MPPYPPLYAELSAALADLYADDSVPLNPAKAAADLGAARPAGALVAADPGPAGLWIARTFPTTESGSVIVPSRPVAGLRRRRRRRVVARRPAVDQRRHRSDG